MKVAIGTVVYDGLEKNVIEDYIKSVNDQNTEFDVLLINDGLSEKLIERIKKEIKVKVNVVEARENAKIYHNRIDLLLNAKYEEYELLILADADDIMSKNRVYEYVNQMEANFDFYYNDLVTMEENYVLEEIPSEAILTDILEENFLGMSTTGIKLDSVSIDFIKSLEEGNLEVFDWYLFSRLLLAGKRGKKIQNVKTYYRIYNRNIAGICATDRIALKKEINVKLRHYNILKKYDEEYKKLFHIYNSLDVEDVKEVSQKRFWWGNIKIREVKKYEV